MAEGKKSTIESSSPSPTHTGGTEAEFAQYNTSKIENQYSKSMTASDPSSSPTLSSSSSISPSSPSSPLTTPSSPPTVVPHLIINHNPLLPMTTMTSTNGEGQPRIFTCSMCSRGFSSKYTLTQHARIHTGEKPYACQFPKCQSSFRHRVSLSRHQTLHTGEKPYTCEINSCGKRFTQKSSLNTHAKRCHGTKSAAETNAATVNAMLPPLPNRLMQMVDMNGTNNSSPVISSLNSPSSIIKQERMGIPHFNGNPRFMMANTAHINNNIHSNANPDAIAVVEKILTNEIGFNELDYFEKNHAKKKKKKRTINNNGSAGVKEEMEVSEEEENGGRGRATGGQKKEVDEKSKKRRKEGIDNGDGLSDQPPMLIPPSPSSSAILATSTSPSAAAAAVAVNNAAAAAASHQQQMMMWSAAQQQQAFQWVAYQQMMAMMTMGGANPAALASMAANMGMTGMGENGMNGMSNLQLMSMMGNMNQHEDQSNPGSSSQHQQQHHLDGSGDQEQDQPMNEQINQQHEKGQFITLDASKSDINNANHQNGNIDDHRNGIDNQAHIDTNSNNNQSSNNSADIVIPHHSHTEPTSSLPSSLPSSLSFPYASPYTAFSLPPMPTVPFTIPTDQSPIQILYTCNYCPEQFLSKLPLQDHKLVLHSHLSHHTAFNDCIKVFGCGLCNRMYKTKKQLKSHQKHRHQIVAPVDKDQSNHQNDLFKKRKNKSATIKKGLSKTVKEKEMNVALLLSSADSNNSLHKSKDDNEDSSDSNSDSSSDDDEDEDDTEEETKIIEDKFKSHTLPHTVHHHHHHHNHTSDDHNQFLAPSFFSPLSSSSLVSPSFTPSSFLSPNNTLSPFTSIIPDRPRLYVSRFMA